MVIYLVCVVPDSDTYAALHRVAYVYDSLVISLLLLKQCIRGGQCHANIKFGDSNLF